MLGFTPEQKVQINEGNYAGGFSLTGCSAGSGATCSTFFEPSGTAYICYSNIVSAASVTFYIAANAAQIAITGASTLLPAPYTCTVTVSDAQSHSATYTVSAQ